MSVNNKERGTVMPLQPLAGSGGSANAEFGHCYVAPFFFFSDGTEWNGLSSSCERGRLCPHILSVSLAFHPLT